MKFLTAFTLLFSVFYVLVIAAGCSAKKIKDKNIDIVIDLDLSYTYDLANGIYTVHFMDKPDTAIKFYLSPDEKNMMVDMYYGLEIDNITGVDKDLGTIVIEDNCMTMPKFYTILHVKSKTKKQDIQIDEGCDDLTLSNATRGRSVKLFLDFINTVLRSKPEIKNAPASNVIYK